MSDDFKTRESPLPELDERTIAKRYGLRELVYPDSEQVKALNAFLTATVESKRCGAIPKTAAMIMLDFLQGTINRQHLTKGPRMTQEEFDAVQTPYYIVARVVAKIQRKRRENAKGRIYQATYLSVSQFIELLRSLLDPGCYWMRVGNVPDGVLEVMEGLRDFLDFFPEQRRKGRAV
jgi:hypothetical protein